MRETFVLRRYSMTMAALENLFVAQGRRCAICKVYWEACVPAKTNRYERHFLSLLCVDHDHVSGRVRGLLCNACNTAIGLLGEDVTRLQNAIDYLGVAASVL